MTKLAELIISMKHYFTKLILFYLKELHKRF